MSERRKRLASEGLAARHWFWRTYDQQEIDLIEESSDGERLSAFEFKWNPSAKERRRGVPRLFLETYPRATASLITPENVIEFLAPPRSRLNQA